MTDSLGRLTTALERENRHMTDDERIECWIQAADLSHQDFGKLTRDEVMAAYRDTDWEAENERLEDNLWWIFNGPKGRGFFSSIFGLGFQITGESTQAMVPELVELAFERDFDRLYELTKENPVQR